MVWDSNCRQAVKVSKAECLCSAWQLRSTEAVTVHVDAVAVWVRTASQFMARWQKVGIVGTACNKHGRARVMSCMPGWSGRWFMQLV